MKTVIFANGEIEHQKMLQNLLEEKDFLIAVDGGLRHIRILRKLPDLLVGDLDSVSEEDLIWLREKKVAICQFPPEKDQTDLELAILAAIDLGSEKIVIAGALGGRIDQTLANINLLLIPEIQNIDVRMDDGLEELFLIPRHAVINGAAGDSVSLIPLHSPARGIVTKRLKYKLNNETLFPERSRGISNVMKNSTAEVTLKSGLLLCIHTRKEGR